MARSFNGTDGRLECSTALVTAMPFTFAAWVWVDSLPGDQQVMGVSRALSAGDFSFFELVIISTGAVRARNSNAAGTAQAATTSTLLAAGSWHHAAAVFTSTTSRAAYLDGGGKGTNATSVTALNALNATTIGANHSNAAFTKFLNGRVAYPTIWNISLSDQEILNLASGLPPYLVQPQAIIDTLGLDKGGIEFNQINAFFPTGGQSTVSDPQKQQR